MTRACSRHAYLSFPVPQKEMARRVLVYTDGGNGASPACVQLTMEGLKLAMAAMNKSYSHLQISAATTTPDEIKQGILRNETSAILVMPGGRDLPYVKSLSGYGNQEICHFVRDGGSYLGLCAGAYYGCSRVAFAEGDPVYEVCGERELKLVSGTATGPIFNGFEYTSNSGARTARISYTTSLSQILGNSAATSATVYYNGGCHIQLGDSQANGKQTVLAYYTHREEWPAIVASSYGRGRVVVSGVHIEASTDSLAKVYSYDSIISSLLPAITEQDRQHLLVGILEYLIHCKNK